MSTKTLAEFKKSWWWKRKDIRRNGVDGVTWPLVAIAARNYEIMRRTGQMDNRNYLELAEEEQMIVHRLWVPWQESPMRTAFSPEEYLESGWTPVYESVQRQWNLRLADKTLIDAFIKEIRQIRQSQHITPKHPNAGKKNRGVSWRYIELLDRFASRAGKSLSASERHMLSKARKSGSRYARQYRKALAEWKSRPHPMPVFEAITKEETSVMQQLAHSVSVRRE